MGLFSFLFGSRAKSQSVSKRETKRKQFKIRGEDIVSLIPPGGSSMVSDHILVDGLPVGYMYRQAPEHEVDSGWTFMSGRESQEYADDPDNWAICELNTVANYDRAIIPYLQSPIGTRLDRVPETAEFQPVNASERSA